MTTASPAARSLPSRPWPSRAAALLAALLLAGGLALLWRDGSGRLAAAAAIGAALGVALYHGSFGFTHGFRTAFSARRTAGARAILLLLAAHVLLFFPALAAGEIAGSPVRGFVFPWGLELALGAFLFGIGMQIGGGCASGTLYTAGGGNARMLLTLLFFIVGMSFGARDAERFAGWPAMPALSLPAWLGTWPALALHLALLAGLSCWLARLERARHGSVQPLFGPGHLWRGPWPLGWAALAIAALNGLTLWVVGRPWGITQAFATWGSQAAERLGLADPVFWPYWEDPVRAETLLRPLHHDVTTLMDVGLMAGALLAAGLAGRFAPDWRIPPRHIAASILGGLLLGYGARMASGCNISAFLSGAASGSLHGWVWIAAALPGTWLGIRLRPLFGLAVEH